METRETIEVRRSGPEDIPGIIDLCHRVYPDSAPWTLGQLTSHQLVFPDGQLVAVSSTGRIYGTAASLVVHWDDYEDWDNWRDFTDNGLFTNHDLEHGRTLYGAEVMVDPASQGKGIGKKLYSARRELCQRFNLLRIRAGARLRGYQQHAASLSAAEYVAKIIRDELGDPTLSFQLRQGFEVLDVVQNYLRNDPESLGWAALIEWLNPEQEGPESDIKRDPRFVRPVDDRGPKAR